MNRNSAKHRYSIGELVDQAYKQARDISRDRKVVDLVATKILESWLSHSDRPDMVRVLQSQS